MGRNLFFVSYGYLLGYVMYPGHSQVQGAGFLFITTLMNFFVDSCYFTIVSTLTVLMGARPVFRPSTPYE